MNQVSQLADPSEPNEVSISLNKRAFADFVLDFLGKKEKLTYNEELDFILSHNDIEQFYYLLNEKVSREKNVFIDHFLVTIVYNDNTTREISGIASLNAFLETRHVIPTSITLTWNIIVKFPNAETVENQQIDLTFNIQASDSNKRGGAVILTISHTNQAWGIEVLNLIKDHVNNISIVRPRPALIAERLLTFFRDKGWMSIMMAFLIIPTLTMGESKKVKETANYYYKVAESIHGANVHDLSIAALAVNGMDSVHIMKAADELVIDSQVKKSLRKIGADKDTTESRESYLLIAFVSIIVAIFLGWYYLEKLLAYYVSSSQILLTKRAESNYVAEKASKSKGEFYSLTFVSVSLVLGTVGNFIYQIIINMMRLN